MKKNILILVFSLMVGAVIFSVLRYVAISQAKGRLEQELFQTKDRVGLLEEQLKQGEELIGSLNEEKRLLSANLKERETKISQLEEKNAQNQEQVFSLVNEIDEVRKQRDRTMQNLLSGKEKIKELETKMQSIPELKKAIKELKIRMRKRSVPVIFSGRRSADIPDAESNLGYLIKNGASTYKPQIKIEVTAAQ